MHQATFLRPWDPPANATMSLPDAAGIRWHLKRAEHAKKISFSIREWPGTDHELQELGALLGGVSHNLQQLEWLVSLLPYCLSRRWPTEVA